MAVDVILGLQWGDEGKGKIVDLLAEKYDLVCRFQGGPNAGHTIKIEGSQFVLHTIPSGVFRDGIANLIGNGVVVDPITLEQELKNLQSCDLDLENRLFMSKRAHLILPTHRYLDLASESAKGVNKIGSTLRGIGPTYMDKTGRNGLRAGDLISSSFESKYQSLKEKHLELLKIYPLVDFDLDKEEEKWMASLETIRSMPFVDGEFFVDAFLQKGKNVLAEGAQGAMLDIDYGTYPFVTSSNTITAGVCHGLGVAPHKIREVIGISKAYCTRVGSGPFPTELMNSEGQRLRDLGGEYGATTGRPRRCGWLDMVQLKYSIMLNGVTQIVLTKIDVLNDFETIKVAEHYIDQESDEVVRDFPYDLGNMKLSPVYKELEGWKRNGGTAEMHKIPPQIAAFIAYVEQTTHIPVRFISIGPGRNQIVKFS